MLPSVCLSSRGLYVYVDVCFRTLSQQRATGPNAELVMGHFFKTQPTQNFWTQPNPQKSSPDPTQPISDTWYGILG